MKTVTWEVEFAVGEETDEMAFAASRKTDWGQYYLLMHTSGGKSLAGKGRYRLEGDRVYVPMNDVDVERVRHGQGLCHLGGVAGFYSGQWRYGVPHGLGTTVSALGRVQGMMEEGHHRGRTTVVSSRGDVFRGTMGHTSCHAVASLFRGHEYADGVATGHGRMDFVDGSRYEGAFEHGMPCGLGKYFDATGALVEGSFGEWGLLHGEGAATSGEAARVGVWRHGVLEQHGSEIDLKLGPYYGDFQASMRHGFGRVDMPRPAGIYIGDFRYGRRGGRGRLDCNEFAGAEGGAGSDGGAPGASVAPTAPPAAAPPAAAAGAAAPFKSPAAEAAAAALASRHVGSALQGGAVADTLYSTAPHVFLPEYADYRVEGRWRAGTPRSGGAFIFTHGATNPLDFSLLPTQDPPNHKLPVLDRMLEEEAAEMVDRGTKTRANSRSVRHQRSKQEGFNRKRFQYWLHAADDAMQTVIRRNRDDRGFLTAIAGRLAVKRERRERLARPLEEIEEAQRAEEEAAAEAAPLPPTAFSSDAPSGPTLPGIGRGRGSATLRSLMGGAPAASETEASYDTDDDDEAGTSFSLLRRPQYGREAFRPDAVTLAAEAVRAAAAAAAAGTPTRSGAAAAAATTTAGGSPAGAGRAATSSMAGSPAVAAHAAGMGGGATLKRVTFRDGT